MTASIIKSVGVSLIVLALGLPAPAQQPNSATARLTINGVDGPTGPLAATLDTCTGISLEITGTPSSALALVYGPLQTGLAPLGAVGILDLNISSPSFTAIADGIFGGAFGGDPILNSLAQTDLGGSYTLSAGITNSTPPGAFGAVQALVGDPSNPSGFSFTAATDITIAGGATGGTLSPAADASVLVAITAGSFSFYGNTYTELAVHENGVLAFARPGGGAVTTEADAAFAPIGALLTPTTNSAGLLGIAGAACPAAIGIFEDLSTQANGGAGSIIFSENTDTFSVTYCDVLVNTFPLTTNFTVVLYKDTSPTPGRIDIAVNDASNATQGNGRMFGISPGGDGTVSRSFTGAGINISAASRNIGVGAVNSGFTAAAPTDAIFESFNFAWAFDPINPAIDLVGELFSFTTTNPLTAPYTLTAAAEAPFTVSATDPVSSVVAGGGMITISGTGFRNDGSMSADLGGNAITGITYVDSETLTGTIPASAASTVNVNVFNGSLPGTASLPGAFTYSAGPLNGSLPSLTDEEEAIYNLSPSLYGSIDLYNNNFTQVFVSANGFVSMASSGAGITYISDPAMWNARADTVVAPLWNDLCGDVIGCGTPMQGNVTTVETTNSLTITWNNWFHWPNLGGPYSFSVTFDNSSFPGATTVTFDYSACAATPNVNLSQPGGQSGIIVGMKGPAISTATPTDLISAWGGALGAPGTNQGVATSANLFHWMPSVGYVGGVATSSPGGVSAWDFGDATGGGPNLNTSIQFVSQGAPHNDFAIILN